MRTDRSTLHPVARSGGLRRGTALLLPALLLAALPALALRSAPVALFSVYPLLRAVEEHPAPVAVVAGTPSALPAPPAAPAAAPVPTEHGDAPVPSAVEPQAVEPQAVEPQAVEPDPEPVADRPAEPAPTPRAPAAEAASTTRSSADRTAHLEPAPTGGPVAAHDASAPGPEPQPQESAEPDLGVVPEMINLVETWGEATQASASFRIANLGGGTLSWSVTDVPPLLAVGPVAGELVADATAEVAVGIELGGLEPGSYSTSFTVAAEGFEPRTVPVNLTLTELVGENIGAEDMTDLRLIKNGSGGYGGTFAFVNGPGEPPVLEVELDEQVPVGRFYLTPPVDLGPIRYLQIDVVGPVGSWIQPVLEENLGDGDQWTADPFVVYRDDVQRYRVPVADFRHASGPNSSRPLDLSLVQEVVLKIGIPMPGDYGHPADGRRAVRLCDLRLTETSIDIAATLAAGPATVRLDATAGQGTMPRPWEGLRGFQDRTDELSGLGFSLDRESAISINDWEQNANLMPAVGDDKFDQIEKVYRRFPPEVEHMPWIPTIPRFLWQKESDPGDEVSYITQGAVKRPVYAFRPPSDYAVWQDLVDDFVRAHIALGINVRAYSVLNEPDLPLFWQGTEEEAWEFFAKTTEAIKGVDPEIAVAGPSTADMPEPDEIWSFLSYLYEHDVPLEFLSFHGYFESRLGSAAFADAAAMVREMMAEFGDHFADTELTVNEWGYSLSVEFGQRAREPFAAAAVASALKGMVDGGYHSAIWFSLNAALDPFFASGLFDFDGESARPTLYLFDFFNRLGEERVESSVEPAASAIESLASVDPETGVVRVAFWWPAAGNGDEVTSQQVTLDYLLPDDRSYDWERLVIDEYNNNLVEGLGYRAPQPLDAGVVDGPQGELTFELPLYGVSLVTFTPQP